MYIFKAKVKDVPEGRNRIQKHIFAADQETAMMKFKAEYEKPENINYDQVVIESIEEVKEAE
jgi:hypothetical protein